MELVVSHGKELDRSANSWDNLRILDVGGLDEVMLPLWACLYTFPYFKLVYPNLKLPSSILYASVTGILLISLSENPFPLFLRVWTAF